MTEHTDGQPFRSDLGVPEPLRETFSVSRLFRLRRAIKKHPVKGLIYFAPLVLFWTLAMTYGSLVHGRNDFAVQYSPAISLYSIILGILVYPVRLFWMPTLAAGAIFLVPIMIPALNNDAWQFTLQQAPEIVLYFLISNMVMGTIIGLSVESVNFGPKRFTPYGADIAQVMLSAAIFIIVNVTFILTTSVVFQGLDPDIRAMAGLGDNYVELAIRRSLRGGSVMLAFFLIILQRPKRRDFRSLAATILLFIALAFLHTNGLGGFPSLDASVVAVFLAVVLPSSIATLSLALGIAIYAAATGTYLNDQVFASAEEALLDTYSIIVLQIGTFVLALRSYFETREQEHVNNINRLDAARDFADVGIFAVNLNRGLIRLDKTGMRVMGIDQSVMSLETVLQRMRPEDRLALESINFLEAGKNANLNIRITRHEDDIRDLMIYVWSEQTDSGLILAFGLVLDVTEQNAQATKLRRTLSELQEKDEKQRRMFSIISHELRTPASVISLLADDLTAENVKETQAQLQEGSEQLLGVLADMRQAVNPDQNMTIQKGAYAPAAVAQSVRNTLHYLAEEKQMEIVFSLAAGAENNRIGDQLRVKQVLGNLVKNALVHSGGTYVKIAFEELIANGRSYSRWTVSDDGKGIPKEDIDRLFEPFERGGVEAGSRPDGSGLGLFIAKLTVEALSGKIEYLPQIKGVAYQFTVPEDMAPARASSAPAPSATTRFDNCRVLLVEDHVLMGQVTQKQLERHFGRVDLAQNGRIALEYIRKDPPDLVITDLFMPELEGDELIREMLQDGFDIPTVGLTAAAVGNDMDRFHEVGAELVLQKPLNMDEVLSFAADVLAPSALKRAQ